eukprot:CAMPEP_0194026476 /NCGR_PEP_ID=MMETSP0009_2-20130614/766_1 /TAXON_ID=210454 /ORGANISM="Grammatophora oceanica, Strain CCMP 410" /LENGTH=158 /DNA_ID=CAMNT_0038665167 /DNA_START=145 /DNA_END=618 /DNA_ORIENTATION=+
MERTSPTHAFSAAVPTSVTSPELKTKMEETVLRYFTGVTEKDSKKIRSCFGETATIRDVCGLNDSTRTVPSEDLVERCMDFVTAHPDCVVNFHYGPECGRTNDWIVAHWYETGTWTGESCGLKPTNEPMAVEGQTRFLVDPESLKITDFVVTRTFTEW